MLKSVARSSFLVFNIKIIKNEIQEKKESAIEIVKNEWRFVNSNTPIGFN